MSDTQNQNTFVKKISEGYDSAADNFGHAKKEQEKKFVGWVNKIESNNPLARFLKSATNYIFDEHAPFRRIALEFNIGDIFLGITEHLAARKEKNKDKPKDNRSLWQKTKDFFVGDNNIFHRTKEFFVGEKNFIYRIKHGEGIGFKTLAGILGIINTTLWFFSGEDSNHDAITRLDKALVNLEQKNPNLKGEALLDAAIKEATHPKIIRELRKHGGWLGNFVFALSGASMAASGLTQEKKKWFDVVNGLGNIVAYGAKALKGFEQNFMPKGSKFFGKEKDFNIFGTPDEAPKYENGKKPNILERISNDFRYDTEKTQSNMGMATTLAGGGTAIQYATEGKYAAAGSQGATFTAYMLGDLDLRYTEKQVQAQWLQENKQTIAAKFGIDENKINDAIKDVEKTGKLTGNLSKLLIGSDGLEMSAGNAALLMGKIRKNLKEGIAQERFDKAVDAIQKGENIPDETVKLIIDEITKESLFSGVARVLSKHEINHQDKNILAKITAYLCPFDMVAGMKQEDVSSAVQHAQIMPQPA